MVLYLKSIRIQVSLFKIFLIQCVDGISARDAKKSLNCLGSDSSEESLMKMRLRLRHYISQAVRYKPASYSGEATAVNFLEAVYLCKICYQRLHIS